MNATEIQHKIEQCALKLTQCSAEDKRIKKRLLQALGKLKKQLSAAQSLQCQESTSPITKPVKKTIVKFVEVVEEEQDDVDNNEAEQSLTVTNSVPKKMLKAKTKLLNRELAELAQKKQLKLARKKFDSALKKGLSFDTHTYANMMNVYVRCGDVEAAEALLDEMRSVGLIPNLVVYTTLLKGYCEAGDMNKASQLYFDEILSGSLATTSTRTLNTLLRGCVRSGEVSMAVRAYQSSLSAFPKECVPDSSTYEYYVGLLAQNFMLRTAIEVTSTTSTSKTGSGTAAAAGGVEAMENAAIYLSLMKSFALLGLWQQAVQWGDCTAVALEKAASAPLRAAMMKKSMLPIANDGNAAMEEEKRQSNERNVSLFLEHRQQELQEEFETIQKYISSQKNHNSNNNNSADTAGKASTVITSTAAVYPEDVIIRLLSALSRVLYFHKELDNDAVIDGTTGAASRKGLELRSAVEQKFGAAHVSTTLKEFGHLSPNQWNTVKTSLQSMNSTLETCLTSTEDSSKYEYLNFNNLFAQSSAHSADLPIKLEICSGSGEWVNAQAAADINQSTGKPNAKWIALELRCDRVHDILSRNLFTCGTQSQQLSSNKSASGDKDDDDDDEGEELLDTKKRKMKSQKLPKNKKKYKKNNRNNNGTEDEDAEAKAAAAAAVARAARVEGCSNIAVLGGDASYILPHHIAPNSVSELFVNHPEPPERTSGERDSQGKHLLTREFIVEIYRVLQPGGLFTIVTDNLPYAKSLMNTVAALFDNSNGTDVRGFVSVPMSATTSSNNNDTANNRILEDQLTVNFALPIKSSDTKCVAAADGDVDLASVDATASHPLITPTNSTKIGNSKHDNSKKALPASSHDSDSSSSDDESDGEIVYGAGYEDKFAKVRASLQQRDAATAAALKQRTLLAMSNATSVSTTTANAPRKTVTDSDINNASDISVADEIAASSSSVVSTVPLKNRVQLWRADYPGVAAGHVASSSSYFDRMWDRGKKKRRWFLALRKI